MPRLGQRLHPLFTTTEGLLLTATGWDALIIAALSIFSGPLASLELPARLGLTLDDAGRVGRIVMLYHALAVPFVAALVYLILDRLSFDERIPRLVRPPITAGYMLASAGAIGFAYFSGRNWLLHGVFIAGLSLIFFAGVVLADDPAHHRPHVRATRGLALPGRDAADHRRRHHREPCHVERDGRREDRPQDHQRGRGVPPARRAPRGLLWLLPPGARGAGKGPGLAAPGRAPRPHPLRHPL